MYAMRGYIKLERNGAGVAGIRDQPVAGDKSLSPGILARPARRTMGPPPAGLRPPVQARIEVSPLELDWSQIVRRCMDGDSGAWAELVRTHHRRVYGLCYRLPATQPTPKT